jgi:hypothetical protein
MLNQECKLYFDRQAGEIYTITKIQDLHDRLSDLECIFRAAEIPEKVPEGALPGTPLMIGNSLLLNPLRVFWSGKYTMKIECKKGQEDTFLGWNHVALDAALPFVALLGRLSDIAKNPHPLYNDNKTSIILDYSSDIREYCSESEFNSYKAKYPERLKIKRSPFDKTVAPINFLIDVIRPVGKQEDGGTIFLGVSYGQDFYSSKAMASPIMFFTVVSYDTNVVPSMKPGQSLKPLVGI